MKKLNVLLIEDNPIHARLIEGLLAQMGSPQCQLQLATSLASGLELFGKGKFDVILLDLVLPDSQELETYLRVRQLASQTAIVILTNLDNVDLASQAVEAGAQQYLIKTQTNSAALAEAINNALVQAGQAE